MTNPDAGINVRSAGYSLAIARASCADCGRETRLAAVLLPPGHETLDDEWERVPRHAFLFFIELLPHAVHARLRQRAPGYRYAASAAMQGSYWVNHCEFCGAMQEDHDLFCEPEGAFLPVSAAAASLLELVPVREPFHAAAAGHAIDPPFVGSVADE